MEGTTLHGLLWHWGRSGCCEVWTDVCVEIVYGVIFPTSGEIVRDHGQIKPCVNVDGASPPSEGWETTHSLRMVHPGWAGGSACAGLFNYYN